MIDTATTRAENGVAIAERMGSVLEEISTSTEKVNTLLTEIASASKEQASGIGQVNTGVSQLDAVTQQNAGNSEELASAAEETSAQSATLRELVGQFKVSEFGETQSAGGTFKKPKSKEKTFVAAAADALPKNDAEALIPMDGDLETF